MSDTASIDCLVPESRSHAGWDGASADVTTSPGPHFERNCIEKFEWLAVNQPVELARLVLTQLQSDPVLLSQAAEAMALSRHSSLVTRVLLPLLQHSRPFVRESALLGLAPFLASSLEARDWVRTMAQTDASPGVREAAAEALMLL